jgi:hypothetical protein
MCNPDANLPSARTLARRLEEMYDAVKAKVDAKLKSVKSTIHFAHDAWTDSARKHCYFGIYATYVDENFEYQEVLLRLLHMQGRHTGERIGDGLFQLFHEELGISHNIGPGTGDNAGNNGTAAERLSQLLFTELGIDQPGSECVGCVCHTANLAALKYILGEGEYGFGKYV